MIETVIGLALLGISMFYRNWANYLVWNRGSWIGGTITAGPIVLTLITATALVLLGLKPVFAGLAAIAFYAVANDR